MEVNFPKLEEEVLERWKKEKSFEKSVQRRTPRGARGRRSPRFVFYEGPPTANGKPGIHHVLSRSFKDVILRYKTMQGFFVERRAGWDTHGLPVELQIEKKLGLKSKKDIEKYGIAQFNKECKQSVWEYKKEWEGLTQRMGFWIDLNNPYITYETPYIETLWRIIQTFWQKGLLYKGHKVVPYCVRCGTPLSSHELAQGYKTVTDRSVTVEFRVVGRPNTSLLAWTTTPWTLPGNVALAVHPRITYVEIEKKDMGVGAMVRFILAKDRLSAVFKDNEYRIVKEMKGSELVGLAYEPLFDVPELRSDKSYKVYEAGFVSTEEGTGIVHTAVMYGVEDFELGGKVGLPKVHTVTEEGSFIGSLPIVGGRKVVKDGTKDFQVEEAIISYARGRNLLFAEEKHEHEYPFCWRCSTPLLYYAREAWFVNMQKVKKELLANNKQINWVPKHLKEGRMGEWLREVKDWAFSRERYWGTPLPIWECQKCEHREVVGSLEELQKKTRSRNTYLILRHGHSERQITKVMSSWPESTPIPLTAKGIKEIGRVAKALKKKKIDVIVSSDMTRARQTAEIVGKELGIAPVFDERLRDVNVGPELNGKHITELGKVWGKAGETSLEHYLRRFVESLPGGESWKDVQSRMYSLVQDLEKKYQGKSVLLVSHELPLSMLEGGAEGRLREDIIARRMKKVIDTGEVRNLPFSVLPLNEDFELDLHRPYIDSVVFSCSACKTGTMQRVKEVADVWYDSGAMPFAQSHWMGGKAPELFPADYIVEGIDQTRGWFYTLLAVSTLLGFKAPYKNVISFSHVLDEKGEKMSKSKGNVVDPWAMIQKYGIDAVRWYFFTMNNPGDPKLFSEKDIQEVLRKFILTLWNSFVFYQTYVGKKSKIQSSKSKIISKFQIQKNQNILDKWILSRLIGATKEITEKLDAYDVTGAGRSLENFVINDLSLWYIRRSRTRFQNPASAKDFKEASATLSFVLLQTSKLAAPFIPFLSEYIHNALNAKGSPSTSLRASVHWEDWPKAGKADEKLEREMGLVRDLVTKALAERAKAQLKVRQPLQKLKVKSEKLKISQELLGLLKDEINVKEVVFDKNLKVDVELDTVVTPELKEEGQVREILRSIQDMRKEAGYKPGDIIQVWYEGSAIIQPLLLKHEGFIKKIAGIKILTKGDSPEADIVDEIDVSGEKIKLSMKL